MSMLATPDSVTAFSSLDDCSEEHSEGVSSLWTAGRAGHQGLPQAPRIVVHGSQPMVVREVVGDLNEKLALAPNWDTYGGRAVSINAARAAVSWFLDVFQEDLPAPSIVPGSDGSIQLEWHARGIDLEVCFESSGVAEFSFEDLDTGQQAAGRAELAQPYVNTLASRAQR